MSFADDHPRIVHYTNFAGLRGILESQQLWASHIRYLNDEAEFVAYLEKRFATIAAEVIRPEYVANADKLNVSRGKGLEEYVAERVLALVNAVRETTVKLDEPFVTSFSVPAGNAEVIDGLLSQWQGYGQDGGFAIEFDSAALMTSIENWVKQ